MQENKDNLYLPPEKHPGVYYIYTQYLDLARLAIDLSRQENQPEASKYSDMAAEFMLTAESVVSLMMRPGYLNISRQWALRRGNPEKWEEKAQKILGLKPAIQESENASVDPLEAVDETLVNRLSNRERQVFSGLLSNKTSVQIAAELGLSPATVSTYTSQIASKFGVRGKTGILNRFMVPGAEAQEIPQESKAAPADLPGRKQPKTRHQNQRSTGALDSTRRTERKKFMWEEDYEGMVRKLIARLAAAGAEPDKLYSIVDKKTLLHMLDDGLITEDEASSGELPVNKLVRAFIFSTSEGKKIRPGFEGRQRALKAIDELVSSYRWRP